MLMQVYALIFMGFSLLLFVLYIKKYYDLEEYYTSNE